VTLFAYDRWANCKVLDACRMLTAEQYVAQPAAGWSSLRSTINHIPMAGNTFSTPPASRSAASAF
jgi:uncharacterized damage-inducible protein DinB